MRTLHVATLPTGKFLLIGSQAEAQQFTEKYRKETFTPTLESEELALDHYVSVEWLVAQNIKKVIHI